LLDPRRVRVYNDEVGFRRGSARSRPTNLSPGTARDRVLIRTGREHAGLPGTFAA